MYGHCVERETFPQKPTRERGLGYKQHLSKHMLEKPIESGVWRDVQNRAIKKPESKVLLKTAYIDTLSFDINSGTTASIAQGEKNSSAIKRRVPYLLGIAFLALISSLFFVDSLRDDFKTSPIDVPAIDFMPSMKLDKADTRHAKVVTDDLDGFAPAERMYLFIYLLQSFSSPNQRD